MPRKAATKPAKPSQRAAVKKPVAKKTVVKKEKGLAQAAGYESSEDARKRLEKAAQK